MALINGDSLAHIAIDPVCELHVDVPTAEHRYDVGRRTVYFSSLNCKKKFAADPIAFASQNSEMAQTYTCGKCRTCDMTLKPERVIGTAVDPVCAMDVHSATTENRVVFGYFAGTPTNKILHGGSIRIRDFGVAARALTLPLCYQA